MVHDVVVVDGMVWYGCNIKVHNMEGATRNSNGRTGNGNNSNGSGMNGNGSSNGKDKDKDGTNNHTDTTSASTRFGNNGNGGGHTSARVGNNNNKNNNKGLTLTVNDASTDNDLTDIHRSHTLTTPPIGGDDNHDAVVRRVSTGGQFDNNHTNGSSNDTSNHQHHHHRLDGSLLTIRTASIDSNVNATIHGNNGNSNGSSGVMGRSGSRSGRPSSPVLYMPTDSDENGMSSTTPLNRSQTVASTSSMPTMSHFPPIPASPTTATRLHQLELPTPNNSSTPKRSNGPPNLMSMISVTPRTAAAARRLASDHMSHVRQTSLLSIDGISSTGSPRRSPRVDLDKELAHTDGHTELVHTLSLLFINPRTGARILVHSSKS
jgi:hypothetical protein